MRAGFDSREMVFDLQPYQKRSFANRAPIASHSVLANVASIALLAASRHLIVNTFSVQQICRTSLTWLNATEPISAGVIRSARHVPSNGSETAVELNVQLPESCVLFGAPSFKIDGRIKGINPSVSGYFCRTLRVHFFGNC